MKNKLMQRPAELCQACTKRITVCILGAAFLLAPFAPTLAKADSPNTAADKKVTICHKGHTITVSRNALDSHLSHGDTIGSCSVTTVN